MSGWEKLGGKVHCCLNDKNTNINIAHSQTQLVA